MKISNPILLGLFFSCVLRGVVMAQQLPNIAFYRHNWSQINPSAFPREYIELRDMTIFTNINARSQMHKVVKGAPRAVDARGEFIFGNGNYTDNKVMVSLHSEQAGAIREFKGQLGYSWITPLTTQNYEVGFLSIGGSVDYNNKYVNTADVNWQSPNEVPEIINTNFMNFNAGAFYYFGISHKDDESFRVQVERNPYKTPYGFVGVSWSQVKALGWTNLLQQKSHLNLIAGGVLRRFEPTVWLRYSPGLEFESMGRSLPFTADFNLRYIYKMVTNRAIKKNAGNQFWLGTGFSTAGTMNIEAGFRGWIDKSRGSRNTPNYYQIGFAYTGFRLSSLAIPRPNDFELNLSWNLSK